VTDSSILENGKEAAAVDPESTAGLFGRLYEQYLPGVYRYVLYRIGEKDVSEDLTSDIFNKALTGFNRFDTKKASFCTWIYTIARNTLIDYYRKQARESAHRREPDPDIPAKSGSPEEAFSRLEEIKKLRECLLKLNANERELISLKFSSDMKNYEIARITGLSESNVGTILCRAVRKLRDDFSGW
jgi:RNA polymerase sigma factor (sigma-70 family)